MGRSLLTNVIVVDLDGTVCDNAHRNHLAVAGEWDAFHSALEGDKPFEDVKWFLELIDYAVWAGEGEMPETIALTGRNEAFRAKTLKWLLENNIAFDYLVMRPDRDYSPDTVIKPRMLDEQLAKMGRARSDVKVILEDRDKVVEEWRRLGFNCWQVRQGTY